MVISALRPLQRHQIISVGHLPADCRRHDIGPVVAVDPGIAGIEHSQFARLAQVDRRKAEPHAVQERDEPRPDGDQQQQRRPRSPATPASATRRDGCSGRHDAGASAPRGRCGGRGASGRQLGRPARRSSALTGTACRRRHATPARRQSCMCRKPTGRPPSSTTNSEVMANRFIRPNASAARRRGGNRLRVAVHDRPHRAGEAANPPCAGADRRR